MILTLVTAPQTEPVSLDEAKDHLRVTTNDDDVKITGYITAARKWVENHTSRALITQTWDMWIKSFPLSTEAIYIPKAPMQSVTSITYVDSNGSDQTVTSSIYTADTDSDPGRVYLAYDQSWPTARWQEKAVKIRYAAGYGDDPDDIPRDIIEGLLLQLQILYDQPTDISAQALEMARDSLINPYRVTFP